VVTSPQLRLATITIDVGSNPGSACLVSVFLRKCVLDTISHLWEILMPTGLAHQHFKKISRKKLNLSFLIRGMDSSVVTPPATQTCHHRTLVRIPTRPVWFSIFLHICVLDTISHLCGILMPTGLAYQHFKKFQEKS